MWSSLSVTASDLKDFTLRTLIVTTSGGECNPIRRTWNWWMLTGRWFSGHLPGNNILDILITGTKNCAPWHLVLRAPDGDNIVDKGGTVTMVTRAALRNIGCISITNRQRVIVSRHPGSAITATGYVHSCIGVHGPGYTRWLELCAAGSKHARLWKVIAGGWGGGSTSIISILQCRSCHNNAYTSSVSGCGRPAAVFGQPRVQPPELHLIF